MTPDPFESWVADLERRHLSELSFPEVRKGLPALSSLYAERRGRIGSGAAFDGAGKRAAFALFFGPLRSLAVRGIVAALGAADRRFDRLLDLGCGTGAAGAAVALAAGADMRGVERSGWAVSGPRASSSSSRSPRAPCRGGRNGRGLSRTRAEGRTSVGSWPGCRRRSPCATRQRGSTTAS